METSDLTPTSLQNSRSGLPVSSVRALSESESGKGKLTSLLEGCFALQKMYGRAPESMEIVEELFQKILAPYPAKSVIRAMEIWLERNQEFPTPADIVGLIKRRGRLPLSKEMYIALSKKDPEYRTDADWSYLKEYERDQDTQDAGFQDETKDYAADYENTRLREEVRTLRLKVKELTSALRAEQNRKAPEPTLDDKVRKTVKYMREIGAPEADITEFLRTQEAA